MISIEIFKLDSDDNPISTLKLGEHILGRGALLECDDRRVSRNHGVITIADNKASITSTHQNPCFYIFANSKAITILPKDSPVDISDGDKFALLADQFWFKIKLKRDDTELPCTNLPENNDTEAEITNEDKSKAETLKRHCEDESSNENKKFKTFNNTEILPNLNVDEQLHGCTHEEVRSESDTKDKLVNGERNELKEESAQIEKSEEKVVDETTNNAIEPEGTASTSSKKRPFRDYCVYGMQCYRKSAAHLADFSHPGDSDYESDPNDQRPVCDYGPACYRKNKQHRQAYKHPRDMDVDNLKKPVGMRKKLQARNCCNCCNCNPSKKPDYESDYGGT
ncbi:hypothetical protein RI129_002406 [Pyrocoelia pectoralis]|uniref:PBZ-type domain-containing protein n=1 Tax=Pyrocoelia pectoralis TaxID=417401 RepID=A0AAN7VIW8_9COLE